MLLPARSAGYLPSTRSWIVQNYLQVVLCPVVSIIAIHACMVSPTLISQGFNLIQNRLASLVTKSPPFTRSLPLLCSLHLLPVRFKILFKINLLTYKTLIEKWPVYLHSMLFASLPFRSLWSKKDNSLSIKTNTGARAFHPCAPSLWKNRPLSDQLVISVATFQKHLKTHLFDLGLPP